MGSSPTAPARKISRGADFRPRLFYLFSQKNKNVVPGFSRESFFMAGCFGEELIDVIIFFVKIRK